MFKALGVIAEYNPFHNGHLYHLNESRQKFKSLTGNDNVIALMSGNFTQRGEPAAFDKWTRAIMAVKAGVDLVLELPFAFSVRSAQYFARGGVRIFKKLKIISHISFGAEDDDLAKLNLAALKIDSPDTINIFRQEMKLGKTYAAAISSALSANKELTLDFLSRPNNILAIEYLRALTAFAPAIAPIVVKRQDAGHNAQTITGPIASAKAIRRELCDSFSLNGKISGAIPPEIASYISDLLKAGQIPASLKNFDNMILAKLRTAKLTDLKTLPDVSEGLHYKIAKSALKAASTEELLALLKTKRYPLTRLQRILIHALLNTTKEEIALFDEQTPLYARVLAFNDRGRILLKELKTKADIPVISKAAPYLKQNLDNPPELSKLTKMLKLDSLATDIYTLSSSNPKFRVGGLDFLNSPCYVTAE